MVVCVYVSSGRGGVDQGRRMERETEGRRMLRESVRLRRETRADG